MNISALLTRGLFLWPTLHQILATRMKLKYECVTRKRMVKGESIMGIISHILRWDALKCCVLKATRIKHLKTPVSLCGCWGILSIPGSCRIRWFAHLADACRKNICCQYSSHIRTNTRQKNNHNWRDFSCLCRFGWKNQETTWMVASKVLVKLLRQCHRQKNSRIPIKLQSGLKIDSHTLSRKFWVFSEVFG